jgi:hypothetical protein
MLLIVDRVMGLPEHFSDGADAHIRAERELRYLAIAPIVLNGSAWCDLGRESSSLAARLLPNGFEGRLLLVDESRHSLEEARRRLGNRPGTTILLEPDAPEPLTDVRDLLTDDAWSGATVTCFELAAEPEWFGAISEFLRELHAERNCTVAVGIPNLPPARAADGDRPPLWGESAIAELRQLFDGDTVVARQLPLTGSQILLEGSGDHQGDLPVSVHADGQPLHTLLAWGPSAHLLAAVGNVVQADLVAQRMLELARDAELEYLRIAMDSTGADQPRP